MKLALQALTFRRQLGLRCTGTQQVVRHFSRRHRILVLEQVTSCSPSQHVMESLRSAMHLSCRLDV